MSSSRSKVLVLGIAAVFVLIIVITIESQTKFFRRFYDDVLMDNKNHYLPCSKLPPVNEVIHVIEQHEEIITKIEQIHPDQAGVEVDSLSCPGKADIVIWYASHEDRIKIEQIINDEFFFGVPYRLQNR